MCDLRVSSGPRVAFVDSRVQGLSVLLEVSLVGLEHAVEPRQQLLGAVVRVEDDGAIESA